MNYYNEIDPYCARWLNNLMIEGLIPFGDIDTRSIEDVIPNELSGYDQCHFFAGLGGWPLALSLAGWPSGRPVWTGSCPCQPFSAAGKGAGFADERHLWPSWQHLISQCRPSVVFGEQVASKDADPWIDLVHADMEGMGYAFGCVPFPAAGIGAPHIRDRNYWVAYADNAGSQGRIVLPERSVERTAGSSSLVVGLADAGSKGLLPCTHAGIHRGEDGARSQQRQLAATAAGYRGAAVTDGNLRGLARACCGRDYRFTDELCPHCGHHARPVDSSANFWFCAKCGNRSRFCDTCAHRPSAVNGFWADADWLLCTDGKWRPVEPGTFPLAHGVSNRVGRLRAYGNAIVPQAAAEFIEAYLAKDY
jgi:DNA (cytosine-5)-methyltransferase 1